MAVPILPELIAIRLNVRKEEGVQQPYVVRIFPFQEIQSLKASEKCPPATSKVSSDL
jgi:hypothetical protein